MQPPVHGKNLCEGYFGDKYISRNHQYGTHIPRELMKYITKRVKTFLFNCAPGHAYFTLKLRYLYAIIWRHFMEGNTITYLMKPQGKYYNRIGTNISSLIWAGILIKNTILMSQKIWMYINRFVHPVLPNCLGVSGFTMLQSKI